MFYSTIKKFNFFYMKNVIVILIIILPLIISCKQVKINLHSHHNPDVYVVGYELNTQNVLVAMLWKNGVPQNLSKGIEVEYENGFTVLTAAHSVYVSGNDIYVSGYENGYTKGVLKLWKNGVVQNFPDNSQWGTAYSVFVSDNDVYVTGSKTWKNENVLYEYEYSGYGNSIFVSDGDVYVAGSRNSDAVLWKNGIAENLPGREGGGDAKANSVFVSNGNVYIAGWKGFFNDNGTEYLIAVLWENGVEIQLTDGTDEAEANSVFVSGNDVYVAGQKNNEAVLWKNGVEQRLTNENGGQSIANSVYVFGDDVYIAGLANATAVLWKNGIKQILTANDSKSSAAYGVFVK